MAAPMKPTTSDVAFVMDVESRAKKCIRVQKPRAKVVLSSPYTNKWPKISTECTDVIVNELTRRLKELQLARLPRPFIKDKVKREVMVKEQQESQSDDQRNIRRQLILGLNNITRLMEQDQLRLVLVSQDSSITHSVTAHMMPLAHRTHCPTAAITNLNSLIAPVLNVKSVAAIAFRKTTETDVPAFDELIAFISSKIPENPLNISENQADNETETKIDAAALKSAASAIIRKSIEDKKGSVKNNECGKIDSNEVRNGIQAKSHALVGNLEKGADKICHFVGNSAKNIETDDVEMNSQQNDENKSVEFGDSQKNNNESALEDKSESMTMNLTECNLPMTNDDKLMLIDESNESKVISNGANKNFSGEPKTNDKRKLNVDFIPMSMDDVNNKTTMPTAVISGSTNKVTNESGYISMSVGSIFDAISSHIPPAPNLKESNSNTASNDSKSTQVSTASLEKAATSNIKPANSNIAFLSTPDAKSIPDVKQIKSMTPDEFKSQFNDDFSHLLVHVDDCQCSVHKPQTSDFLSFEGKSKKTPVTVVRNLAMEHAPKDNQGNKMSKRKMKRYYMDMNMKDVYPNPNRRVKKSKKS